LLGLLLCAAATLSWLCVQTTSHFSRVTPTQGAVGAPAAPSLARTAGSGAPNPVKAGNLVRRESYRLSNTRQAERELIGSRHAVILRNALIDTRLPLRLDIPPQLRAKGAPGSYIVQATQPLDGRFYDELKQAGATFVSFIPNNAALVRATPEQAAQLAGEAMIQAVLPYEPYYKLATALLPAAVDQQEAQSGALNVTTFPGQRDAALAALEALGAKYMSEDSSPFGPTLTVTVPADKLAEVAQMPLAQEVEPYAPRRLLNDLTRVTLGVSADTLIGTSNYLNLTGSNVTVNLNDTGIDTNHPDFKGPGDTFRFNANAPYDYNGHGTHVAGIIMGNGSQSTNVTNQVPGSIMPGADFRGKATNASLNVQSLGLVIGTTVAAAFRQGGTYVSDMALETNASVQLGPTNLISNNSWGYEGVRSYDMHAASFDAATRDAQPGVPGEQPLLFVFAAGDASNGNNNGGGGAENSILSPGTAKNVITVGAIDAARSITNEVTGTFNGLTTNQYFFPWTDNNDLVAWFSSCGNVGPGTETLSGRFKPDVVAPGMFIISCRATNYVDPSYATQVTPYSFGGQVVQPGPTHINTNCRPVPSKFPADTQELIIEATPNSQSPIPFPPLLILGAPSPQPLAVLGTNYAQDQGTNQFVVLTNNLDGVAWDFAIETVSGQKQPVSYDLTFYLVETNDLGVSITNTDGYYHVISNLNSALKPYYMYQYGTSMSAGAVSGMLALMQEFLQTRMNPPLTNPSPALLKALLINGARSVNQQYDFNTQLQNTQVPGLPPAGANEQGWGLPNLPNSLPASLTNNNGTSSNAASMVLVDQSATNALATGQWQTYTVSSGDSGATNYPLRVTLVWTDPPGNPAAGLALVNNLDLIVTAGTTTNARIWLGNDFLSGDIFTTNNSGDSPDLVNNAQNVYIDSTNAPFTWPVMVTVVGARVNVNAVTTQTNRIAQDYALVISSDDPALASALTVSSSGISSGPLIVLAPYEKMTNNVGAPVLAGLLPNFLQGATALVTIASNGVPLLDQRVGANEPNLYTNGILYTNAAPNTNGSVAQWHFFVFTNDQFNATNNATNVAFATFLPPNLATQIEPRTNGADLDLYVSTDSGLTNLGPRVFALMTSDDMSVGRGGTETVIYSNSQPGEVYYIGVKSEDQQAGDFGFYAVAQQAPFGLQNPNGSITYYGSALPVDIPDSEFGQPPARVFAIASHESLSRSIRKLTVTMEIDHGNPGDLYGLFELGSEQTEQVVLNNYSGPPVGEVFINTYNDFADGSGGVSTDGPGSLRNFMGQTIPPLWILEQTDNANLQGGQITSFSVTVFPQPLTIGPNIVTLSPNEIYFDYVVVPTDAIYLTNAVMLQSASNSASLAIYMNVVNDLTFGDSDSTNLVFAGNGLQTPGGYLLVSTNSLPIPLSGGMWYYGISNGGPTTVTFTNQIFFGYNYTPNLAQTFTNSAWTPLTTDGTTNSSQICISNGQQVLDLSVGVRLADPNLDDLVLQLTSPQGSSIVLFENRGGVLASNLGLTLTNAAGTNYIYTTFTEDTNLADVPIKFAPPPYTQPVSNGLTVLASNSFEDVTGGVYTNGQSVDGWEVAANEVSVMTEPTVAHTGSNYLALTTGRLTRTFATVPGVAYELRYYARSPGLTDWWPADDNTADIVGTNNGTIPYSDVTFDVGEVGRAFTFSGIGNPGLGYTGNEVDFGTNVGNFGTNDFTVDFWIKQPTNATAENAVLEKLPECDDSVSLWDIKCGRVWYESTSAPGHLFLEESANNIVDNGIWVSSKAVNDGVFHHAAFVRNGSNYLIYIDGALDTNISGYSTGIANISNSAVFRAGQSHCVAPGINNTDGTIPFRGDLDELDLWQRALSPAEIHAIYVAGSLGKYSTNSLYPNFQVAFDGLATNTVVITNFAQTNWQACTNSFIATNRQTTIELAGNTLSVLLDDVQLVQLPYTNYNNYYLPEEPLAPIIGQNPQGCWTLSIWDTRLDSTQPTNGALLSWTLQLTTSSTNVPLIVLTNGSPPYATNVSRGGIVYFGVDVPALASFATNILSGASGPMNLLFNQSALPTGTLPGDVRLLNGNGSYTLAAQGAPPPLIPGQRYFLGVQNTGSGTETFSLQVNFDVPSGTNIIALNNGVPVANSIGANGPEYYSFVVPPDASLVTFQLLNPTNGQMDLYARDGLPLPGPLNFDYQSENAGTSDQFIVITTNSVPVPLPTAGVNGVLPLSPTTWYLAVYNYSGVSNGGYTILATYVTNGAMTVINLNNQTNDTYQTTAPPGYPTNLVYSFIATNPKAAGVLFTVNNLSSNGNVELLVGEGVYPTPEDFYIGSFNAGTIEQYVSIATNKDLPSVTNVTWYAAVPNTSSSNVTYSITATESTNALASTPLFLGASIASPTNGFTMYWQAVPGTIYQIEVSTDLSSWAVVTNVTAQTSTGSYTDSVPVMTQKARFFRLTVP
jgi:subtilisin-like proprotein convertase family protein